MQESTSETGAAELQRVELEIQDEEGDCDLEDYVEDYGSNLFHFLIILLNYFDRRVQ